ncbi:MAG TPA: hypothetical protein VMN36_03890 [Verrucomicrobiales bacterium]|nr:hypothetical protein [Verrucomicrobiales bacterium]
MGRRLTLVVHWHVDTRFGVQTIYSSTWIGSTVVSNSIDSVRVLRWMR